MSYELIALLMFASMLGLMLTGQRVFAAVGFVAAGAALLLYGTGASRCPSTPRSSSSTGSRC
jgi:hypothetical protein